MKSTFEQAADSRPAGQTNDVIHPDTHLGVVTLRVADLHRSIRFYQEVIGLQVTAQDDDTATLGVDGTNKLCWLRRKMHLLTNQVLMIFFLWGQWLLFYRC